ncbi:hypothetical protein ACFQVD_44740 [Streptosporangium amethystogenes subsp. fukuiense]|uniref:Uncharacterized protein n=1 Tax=Streptosporangium amethystogenes subsp. fukuiense TaxID=698418 RepID=A0ABW2TGW6_9ACTN
MEQSNERPVRRFRTRGGAVVIWEHNPGDTYGSGAWGFLRCGGCGASTARARSGDGNHHAANCHEIPPDGQS